MTVYGCIDCPQMFPDMEPSDREFEVADDIEEPLMCPWCGNQSLIEGGYRPPEAEADD